MMRILNRKRRSSVKSATAASAAAPTAGRAQAARQMAHKKKDELLEQWRRFSNHRNKQTQTEPGEAGLGVQAPDGRKA